MIPPHFQPSTYSFQVQDKGRFRVLLVSEKLSRRAAVRPTMPFWHFELGDRQTLEAMVGWLRFRRALWGEWGKIAQTRGRKALAREMVRLLTEDPPAEAIGFLVEPGVRKDEVVLGEFLAAPTGLKKRIYYRHRFKNAERCTAFRSWLLSNNPEVNGPTLLEIALNHGTTKLVEAIEQITSDEVNLRRKAA